MEFNYFQINKEDKQKILGFLKENDINFQMTRVLTDFLYEEDINYAIDRVLQKKKIVLREDEIYELKDTIFNSMEFYDWDNYDSYIMDQIDSYLN